MSQVQISPRRHPATFLAALAVLAPLLIGAVEAQPGQAATKAKCPPAQQKSGTCPKPTGKSRYKIYTRSFIVLVPHTSTTEGVSQVLTLACPRGEKVLGGGAEVFEPYLSVALSAPDEATTGWQAQLVNLSTTTDIVARVSITAVCELLPPTSKA